MGTRARILAALAAAAASALLAHAGGTESGPAAPVAVGYASGAALSAALRTHPGRIVHRIPALRVARVVPDEDTASFVRDLRGEPGIRYVEALSPRVSADEPALATAPSGRAWEWQYAATAADAVPESVLRAAASVTIAVVDTGADVTAPDIAAKAPVTWSVVRRSADVRDASGHGTFVASLAAGSVENGDGIAGFGGDARLLVVQASRRDTGFTDLDEAQAIVWAVDHGARIVNLSIGGTTTSHAERDAIDYAADRGVLLVAAAGNDFARGNPVQYPAALLQQGGPDGERRGLAVGASTPDGTRAPFSSTGPYVSLLAPGVDVLGAVSAASSPGEYPRLDLPGTSAGLYGVGSGTSYAAPQVAGAAALVWAANPLLKAADVARVLEETATGGTWSPETGWGVLDVAAAVARASAGEAPRATVRLSGKRSGRRVSLTWRADGAVRYRLAVGEDGRGARVLLTGTRTTASYALAPGHVYVFGVDAVGGDGRAIATSNPFRVDVAAARPATRIATRR